MLMRYALIVSALLFAAPTRPLLAQYVDIGDTIRIVLEANPLRSIDGKLVGVSADSIFIARSHQSEMRLTRGAVKALYVSRDGGDSGEMGGWSGMSFGFIIGGVGGAILAGPRILGRMLGAVGGAVVGAVAGAVAGDAIGSRQRYNVWVAIPWPSTPLPEPVPR